MKKRTTLLMILSVLILTGCPQPQTTRPDPAEPQTSSPRVATPQPAPVITWGKGQAAQSAYLDPVAYAGSDPLGKQQQRLERMAGKMMAIPAGRFRMGGTEGDEQPVHEVQIKAFKLGQTEVTQAQWQAVMGDNPSSFKNCGGNCPVENVSWDDIQQFIQKLNQQTGQRFRLPTEAEWEYACRAGGQHEYCGSDNVDSVGWYDKNSGSRTHSVAQKQANAFGLYDMSGNVWEWVQDCYHDNYQGAPSHGRAWETGTCQYRVLRGGSWYYIPDWLRSANRFWSSPSNRFNSYGFRIAQD